MTTNFQLPPELSINSIARELESAGLAQMRQGVNPDDVIGLLLLTPQLLRLLNSGGEVGDELSIPSPVLRSQRLDELEGKALGVRELSAHLSGELSLENGIVMAQQATRNYAKRQMTWMRTQLPSLTRDPAMRFAQLSESLRTSIFSEIRRFLLTG